MEDSDPSPPAPNLSRFNSQTNNSSNSNNGSFNSPRPSRNVRFSVDNHTTTSTHVPTHKRRIQQGVPFSQGSSKRARTGEEEIPFSGIKVVDNWSELGFAVASLQFEQSPINFQDGNAIRSIITFLIHKLDNLNLIPHGRGQYGRLLVKCIGKNDNENIPFFTLRTPEIQFSAEEFSRTEGLLRLVTSLVNIVQQLAYQLSMEYNSDAEAVQKIEVFSLNRDMEDDALSDTEKRTSIVTIDDNQYKLNDHQNVILDYGGACGSGRAKKVHIHGYILQSASGQHGHCFFNALKNAAMPIGHRFHEGEVRKRANVYLSHLNIPLIVNQVTIQQAKALCGFFNFPMRISIFNRDNDLEDVFIFREDEPQAHLVLHDHHWYRYIGEYDPSDHNAPKGSKCGQCGRYFKGKHECKYKQCERCGHWYKNLALHTCTQSNVNWRFAKERGRHFVVANCALTENPTYNKDVVWFDFETHNRPPFHGVYDAPEHVAFASGLTWLEENEEREEKIFYGYDCIAKFLEFLPLKFAGKKKITLIGFNNGSYDNNFVIKKLIEKNLLPKFIISGAAGLMRMSWKYEVEDLEVVILDIRRFLTTMSLRANCKSFNLPVAKGDFPYKFLDVMHNANANINYIGPFPDDRYWEPEEGDKTRTPKPDAEWLATHDREHDLWDLRAECEKYLRKDLECTFRLWDVLAKTIFDKFGLDLKEYITLSQMAYNIWTLSIGPNTSTKDSNNSWKFPWARKEKDNRTIIEIPGLMKDEMIRRATYGGRCYPNKLHFESSHYPRIAELTSSLKTSKERLRTASPNDPIRESLLAGIDAMTQQLKAIYQELYNGDDDALTYRDVVSLYPTAMRNYPYPVGLSREATNEELHSLNINNDLEDLLGIFHVKVKPNKRCVTPVIPRKEVKVGKDGMTKYEGMIWDLEDSEGWYTSVDIATAKKHGYKFDYIEGFVWDQKATIFKDYVDYVYQMKRLGEETKNPALKQVGKICMNALYGKMLQRPCLEEVRLVVNHKQAISFWKSALSLDDIVTYDWVDDQEVKRTAAIFKGIKDNPEAAITKPSQLGAFVLSYSRRIMDDYMTKCNPIREIPRDILPTFDYTKVTNRQAQREMEGSFYYTDTDSLFTKWNQETRQALRKCESKLELGDFSDELEGGLVVKAFFLLPKSYCYEVLMPDGTLKDPVMKCKGIRQSRLTKKHFEDTFYYRTSTIVEDERFKNTKASEYYGYNPFTHINVHLDRRFGKSDYEDRMFYDDEISVPMGFYKFREFFDYIDEDLVLTTRVNPSRNLTRTERLQQRNERIQEENRNLMTLVEAIEDDETQE